MLIRPLTSGAKRASSAVVKFLSSALKPIPRPPTPTREISTASLRTPNTARSPMAAYATARMV